MGESVLEALDICPEKHRLIAVVGAGGKTTLIYRMAAELRERGLRVLVTTTTHMQREGRAGFAPLGKEAEGEKIVGFPPEVPRRFLAEYEVVLVEADGSRRLPFKVPEVWEPVLPVGADLVIGVAGAAALGKPFREACFRYETACRQFGCSPGERITAHHMLASLTGSFGQKKGVGCAYRYAIGQGDLLSENQREELEKVGRRYEETGCILSFSMEKFRKMQKDTEVY